MNQETLKNAIAELIPDTEQFLCRLMSFPSTPGQEKDAMDFAHATFSELHLETTKVPLQDSLVQDADYSDPIPGIRYDGRYNLRIAHGSGNSGRKLLLNTHLDVVPPALTSADPWQPRSQNGVIHGRGACDAKGQVAVIYLLYRLLQKLDIKLQGELVAHLVVEEENGGNGTLAMARSKETADACIVLEPTEGNLFTSIRGAVWFRITFHGKAGHSGEAGVTRSALLMARDAIGALQSYHDVLLRSSRGFPLFDVYDNPMPITFGKLAAGNWPASAPDTAVLEGVLGFLPNKTRDDICAEMRQVLQKVPGLNERFDLDFMYRHDCSILDPQHELPQAILVAAANAGKPCQIKGMTASCDACYYRNQLDIPTVVIGAGSLSVAHSKDEHIALQHIADTAQVLFNTILKTCGAHT